MREIQYKAFSLSAHKKNLRIQKLNVCQFELTFCCGLHCKHCNTDCYNSPAHLKKELTTREVRLLLDKVHQTGALWLCFTGGDPLIRKDFLDIYSYAKDKGFITTIFTNAYSMNKKIAGYFKNRPPFSIEITLSAVTEELYEKISQVKGSFHKAMNGIKLILKGNLPLKIKTQITKDNLEEMHRIRNFIEGLGLRFRPVYDLHARLNGDLTSCNLRVMPDEGLGLKGDNGVSNNKDCLSSSDTHRHIPNGDLFTCAIGSGDSLYIDPYGKAIPCNLIRKPAFDLLKVDIGYAVEKMLAQVRNRKFVTDSKCNGCSLREHCNWCPGRAYVEKGDMEASIEDYCKLASIA